MIYYRGNAAKNWLLKDLAGRAGVGSVRILDLACGSAGAWKVFLERHQNASVLGVDTDAKAIEEGKKNYTGNGHIELRVFDAQQPLMESSFDFVTALSAIEHVVDRPAFLKTVWSALKPGGIAYMNYDAGHFRSRDLKERLMVPVSQVLAMFKYEAPYMKVVDDNLFAEQAGTIGFEILSTRKNNEPHLKNLAKKMNDAQIEAWFAFEDVLNHGISSQDLDHALWSTTLVLRKPV